MSARKQSANIELSNAIHSENRRRNMTMTDLADDLGISHIYMYSLSNGARPLSALSIEKQRKLAAYLRMPVLDFLVACGALKPEDLLPNPQSHQQDDGLTLSF
ncbi:MAG: helix-turn-helix transcriptional regulator [Betaproteobacteria bacterium]|nr:helix-turn-helix transcriptional regulator [Betaproteobacteria bacterium]